MRMYCFLNLSFCFGLLLVNMNQAAAFFLQAPPQIPTVLEIFTQPATQQEKIVELENEKSFVEWRTNADFFLQLSQSVLMAGDFNKMTAMPTAGVKHILKGRSHWEKMLIKMNAAPEDIYYVKFYKDGNGRMRAKVTKDLEGNVLVEELRLVSWAPATERLAHRVKAKFGSTLGARFNIHGLKKGLLIELKTSCSSTMASHYMLQLRMELLCRSMAMLTIRVKVVFESSILIGFGKSLPV